MGANNSLISHLESSFSKIPNPHTVHFTVLSSAPRRTTSLYPYAVNHPRCFQVDYLVTLATEVDRPDATPTPKDGVQSRDLDGVKDSEQVEGKVKDTGKGKGKGRVLTTALSAHLYILPHHRTSILYISKLDSSGHPNTPTPLSRIFITTTLSYFLDPRTRPTPYVRIQLFARSQGQYLFPNSSEGPKKVLGGLGLCGWWKGVYEDIASSALQNSALQNAEGGEGEKGGEVKLGMVLPGYSWDEAKGMLGQRRPLAKGLEWTANAPFDTPLPLPTTSSSSSSSSLGSTSLLGPTSSCSDIGTSTTTSARPSLASLIPSLPDDPKARFLDDLVSEGAEDPRRHLLLKAKPDQTTGSGSSSSIQTDSSPGKKIQKNRAKADNEAERRFTQATLERVSVPEYWERMGFRQECISGDVTGFFTLESSPPVTSTSAPMTGSIDPKTPPTALPYTIVDRILSALLNTDFKSFETSLDHSALWERSVRSLVVDEIGEEGYKACIGSVEGKKGEEGDVPVKRKEEVVVTMLQPRKKKKV
jgi:regulator of Ty1 transposition protein 109